jgi:hypothetical protein
VVARRLTMRQLRDARNDERREEMKRAIAEGRLIVRQMTPKERRQADCDRASGARVRAKREADRDRARGARAKTMRALDVSAKSGSVAG